MSTPELRPERIVQTIEKLVQRIAERFPESSLRAVCSELADVARQAQQRARWIDRPIWPLRLAAGLLVAGLLAGFVVALWGVDGPAGPLGLAEFVQVLEAGINDLVLIGAAVFFLVTLERRVKRSRALAAIHELRSLAHIIDMHQLTKDPERVVLRGARTASSPREDLTPFELDRYLDYCTEMLSLLGKIAALYVQHFDDGVALASANEVESLATGLSRKIWQKIMLLHAMGQWKDESVAGGSKS